MKDYLDHLIVEQRNRALTLKDLIELPVKSVYLLQLVERCNSLLDSHIATLNQLRKALHDERSDLRLVHRKIRMIIKQISIVESYGIPSLRYQSPEVDFLNALVFKIGEELVLPITVPSVSCLSTDYFYFEPITRIIYVPLAEPDFLLHLPDLYHEIGHSVVFAAVDPYSGTKLRAIGEAIDKMLGLVTTYFGSQIRTYQMRAGPREIPMVLERVHANWKGWLGEFLADLFAAYTLGPAFVWSNYHLIAKMSENIYQRSWFSNDPHPANEARMRLMLHGLSLIGFSHDIDLINKRWTALRIDLDSADAYYDMAYPDSLLREIAVIFLAALKQSKLSIVTAESLGEHSIGSIRGLLNDAWDMFWKTHPEEYREWETKQLKQLKAHILHQATIVTT